LLVSAGRACADLPAQRFQGRGARERDGEVDTLAKYFSPKPGKVDRAAGTGRGAAAPKK
jgi:hypothetical protein